MRVWLVVLYLGKSVAVAGSFPSMAACRDAAEHRERFAPAIEASGHEVPDVTLDCVASKRRPAIGRGT